MNKLLLSIALATLTSFNLFAQSAFQNAYAANPYVPAGLLEAVAWTNTHMVHLQNHQDGCSGIPKAYGIMGLFDDGKHYFIENGKLIAKLSGISIDLQKASAENQIMAYATAFNQKMQHKILLGGLGMNGHTIRKTLLALSEIPQDGIVNQLARDMQVYSIFRFMNSSEKAQQYNFAPTNYNLATIFGAANYNVLSSRKIQFTSTQILSDDNTAYTAPANQTKSVEFGPATWNPAPSCNYSSRSGTAISAIAIHTVQGSYAGAISWSQNCTSNVSYHYVIRSSDGQVTQMVLEANKAWHIGSENPYTIGYEHEGYVDDPSWYTTAMYNSSAELSRDICTSGYGIPPLRTYYGVATVAVNELGACTKIKGHQHYPAQTHTDPGVNWDWERYYRLINNNPAVTTLTATSGTFTDSGGSAGNYSDDERLLWLFQPAGASSITFNFSSFSTELNYDRLFIYDGGTIDSPLIGEFMGTNSPGTINSSGGSLLFEFRSDCGTTDTGWNATYTASMIPSPIVDSISPTTSIVGGAVWDTTDFTINFTDSDNMSGVAKRFYLVGEKAISEVDWHSNGTNRFAYESFEDNDNNWFPVTGTYNINAGKYQFSDITEQNSNTYISVNQTNTESYLYEWDQVITSNDVNQRAGLHFFCDNPNLSNRGNSYFVYLRENSNQVEIFSVDGNVFNSESLTPFNVNVNQTYNCKVTFDPSTGWIRVYIDNVFISEWQDLTPLTSGGFISLRSGGCEVSFDNVRVYRTRSNQIDVSVTSEMTIESENSIPTGYVRTIIIDSANNWSSPVTSTYLIDTSTPSLISLNDGNSTDIDTFFTATFLSNWTIEDIHSAITNFEIAVGTSVGLDDIVNWTNNGLSSVYSTVLASPVLDQLYYISVRATNNAGLMSEFSSDGQRYVNTASLTNLKNELTDIVVYPNPSSGFVLFKNAPEKFEVIIINERGEICIQEKMKANNLLSVSELSNGIYNVLIQSENIFIVKKLRIN